MRADNSYGGKRHRLKVRRAWESLRRCSPYPDDFERYCRARGKGKARLRNRIKEKWGIEPIAPETPFDTIWPAGSPVPARIGGLCNLLASYWDVDLVARCQEFEEVVRTWKDDGRIFHPPPGFCPPQTIHFAINVDADPAEIKNRVSDIVGFFRTARELTGLVLPHKRERIEPGRDDMVFRVYDLTEEGKTDVEVAKILKLPDGQRDTQTTDRGLGLWRVAHYRDRAREWIRNAERIPEWPRKPPAL